MVDGPPLEIVLRRDRMLVAVCLAGLSVLTWLYVARLARGMAQMDMSMAMPGMQTWSATDLVLLCVMWMVMMIAMMIPSAAPMILMFASVSRRRREQARPAVPTAIFVLGYLVIWGGFSVLATAAQWGLHEAALLSPAMKSTTPVLGGVILLGAGIYQWAPQKQTCLRHCRSPLGFLAKEWREGARGALVMGVRHGAFCVGCCWLVMALLFVVGVMNLLWVVAIAGFVLIEKIAPRGEWVGRVAGAMLVGWGAWVLVGTL